MNYDEMEKAADELKRIIKEQKGIEPREYAIQGSNGMLFLSYAPGEHFGFPYVFYFTR